MFAFPVGAQGVVTSIDDHAQASPQKGSSRSLELDYEPYVAEYDTNRSHAL